MRLSQEMKIKQVVDITSMQYDCKKSLVEGFTKRTFTELLALSKHSGMSNVSKINLSGKHVKVIWAVRSKSLRHRAILGSVLLIHVDDLTVVASIVVD